MVDFEVVTIEPKQTAVVRAELPVDQLPSLFDRAFHLVMEAVLSQRLQVTGPPFGFYPRLPGETVEVAAGFPVSGPITPTGEVTALELPGGRAVTGIHVGSYDALERTYHELVTWLQAQGLEGRNQMWESYLTDPTAEPDPANWRTQITWPLQEEPR
jgi:effector-binding domain-containing protein